MHDITRALVAIGQGDRQASFELLPLVYDELRRLAAQMLAREAPGLTLDATALVHEAYLRLAAPVDDKPWDSRGHFFAAAAIAMRRILVESARRRARLRHGGGRQREALGDPAAPPTTDDDLLSLDEALTRLAAEDPVAARVVELRHFAGLGHEGVAEALGISVYAARQKWAYARAWVRDALGGPD